MPNIDHYEPLRIPVAGTRDLRRANQKDAGVLRKKAKSWTPKPKPEPKP